MGTVALVAAGACAVSCNLGAGITGQLQRLVTRSLYPGFDLLACIIVCLTLWSQTLRSKGRSSL